jgi:phage baseplate assembly protein W
VDLLHNIWLRLTEQEGVGCKLHHRDVVGVALQRLEEELSSAERRRILEQVENAVHRHEAEVEIPQPLPGDD